MLTDADKHWFAGPHPAGNVGIQIHHTKPISSKDQVWILGIQEVITLGKLITERKYDVTQSSGSWRPGACHIPRHVRTKLGAKSE